MRVRRGEHGDTIIEVIVAVTVFSLVAVGGISLMNQGTATAQRALEIDQTRQQMDAQADALRYLNRAYVASYGQSGSAAVQRWNSVVSADHQANQARPFDQISNGRGCVLDTSDNAFAINIDQLGTANPTVVPTATSDTHPEVTDGRAQGIWIQAVRSPVQVTSGKEEPGYFDFHIRACWLAPGQATPVTLGTIVRLYEPRG